MKKIIIALLFLCGVLTGSEKYAVTNIPPELLPADAVVRNYSIHFEVHDIVSSTEKVSFAVTIFSKEERERGKLYLPYDKFYSLEDFEGTLYDENGNEIRDLDDNDVKDYSGVDDNTLFDETRVKVLTLYHDHYPYTVEYSYEISYNGSLSWPRWIAQEDENPVEKTSFTVVYPKDYSLRFWCNRDSVSPKTAKDGSETILTWSESNLNKIPKDEVQGDLFDVSTIVRIAPTEFQMAQYKGEMTSWKAFGKWYYQLTEGRKTLPEDALKEVVALKGNVSSDRELIQRLYEYMQKRTRYISIQLGIGGWQPFEAAFVHTRGYGDCKALVNYMESLLRAAGIESYPVIINSGYLRFPMITEFPSNQFNHVILCVPQRKDTIWLECTSQSMPFGELSYATENRPALLAAPDGGTVVHTPRSSSVNNAQIQNATIKLLSSGTAQAEILTSFSGNAQNETQHALINESPTDRERWILNRFTAPNVSLSSFAITGLENHSPDISIRVSAVFPRYCSVNGTRIFFNPNFLEKQTFIPPPIEKRLSPIRYRYAFVNKDSIAFKIPDEYTVETVPGEVRFTTSFGSYSSKATVIDNTICYTRLLEIGTETIPAEKYAEFRNFWGNIVRSDRGQVVLKKK